MQITKESELETRKDAFLGISRDLFKLPVEGFVDGLVKDCKGDEELALRTLNNYMKPKDGYNEKPHEYLASAKDRLEKMIESKKNMNFREKCNKIIEANVKLPRHQDIADTSIYYGYKNAISDEELTQLIKYGIHPNILYSKRLWRYETKAGDKIVFQLQGIDKKNLNSGKVKVVTKLVDEAEDGRQFIKDGEIMEMPAKRFLEIIKSPLNRNIYDHLLKGESEDPADWAFKYGIAKTNMRTAFAQWYEENKDLYDFDSYDKFKIQDVYKLTKKGYTIPQAMKRVPLTAKEATEELEEAEKLDINKDARDVRETLIKLGLNPEFMSLPFIVQDNSDLPEEDKEPTRKFLIVGVQDGNLDNPEYFFIRDYDEGGRVIQIPTQHLIDILMRPENESPKLDLWDKASSIRKQNMGSNLGGAGKFHPLTKDEILAALSYIEGTNSADFEGIDLKALFLAPQSFEKRNLLVDKALKAVDPRYQVKAIRTSNGFNGISYQIFIPFEDNPRTKPGTTGLRFSNPYKQITRDWFNN